MVYAPALDLTTLFEVIYTVQKKAVGVHVGGEGVGGAASSQLGITRG